MSLIHKVCLFIIALTSLVACSSVNEVDRGNFGDFQRSLNNKSYGYTLAVDPLLESKPDVLVERFEVRYGDCSSNQDWNDCKKDRERSELSERSKATHDGDRYWYGWQIYFPDNYTNIYPTKVALGQFHQMNSHPVWMFQNADGGYSLDDQVWGGTRKLYPLISEEQLRGKWHKIEIDVKWTRDDNGWFRVWVNGEQKVDYSGQTMEASTVYFKYGIYRSFIERYRIRHSKTIKPTKDDIVPTQTVFYKNVSRANNREGLLH